MPSGYIVRCDGSKVPVPSVMRRVWIPGIQYERETDEQMAERERLCREDDARAEAEVLRLIAWLQRPWWV